jgi:DNA-directed RNA polymerase II subunit RPB1
LALPVYHAGLIEFIRKVLRCVCFSCSQLLLSKEDHESEIRRTKNYQTRFNKVLRLCDPIRKCDEKAGGCGQDQPKFTKSGLRIQIEEPESQMDNNRDRKRIFQPDEALKVLKRISDSDCELLGFRPTVSRPENMIIQNLAVAPPPVRPSVAMSSSNRSEDDLTYAYQQILKTNNQLQHNINKGSNTTTINEIRQTLQYYVATLMDNEI